MNKMRKDSSPGYFTAGELAAMFDISRQSLLYYDKIKLLSPDFIAENGYRHYSITQYLDLEIIVNLRKLDLSIKDIRCYLQNRGEATLSELLNKREKECRTVIQKNERICRSISAIRQKFEQHLDPASETFILKQEEERLTQIAYVDDLGNNKERVLLFARASHKNIHNRSILEKNPGWIIRTQDFLAEKVSTGSVGFFSVLSDKLRQLQKQKGFLKHHDHLQLTPLPAGLYCEATFHGTFYSNAKKLSHDLKNFLRQNALTPADHIYIQPITNHWLTKNPQEYVTRLFLQVNPAKEG